MECIKSQNLNCNAPRSDFEASEWNWDAAARTRTRKHSNRKKKNDSRVNSSMGGRDMRLRSWAWQKPRSDEYAEARDRARTHRCPVKEKWYSEMKQDTATIDGECCCTPAHAIEYALRPAKMQKTRLDNKMTTPKIAFFLNFISFCCFANAWNKLWPPRGGNSILRCDGAYWLYV